ncbi:MAG: PilZ domain-containing protein, partial [Candidatus Glassbacteria bacterium]
KQVSVDTELYLESSMFKARIVDVSSDGVRLELNKPINFHVRFKLGEKRISRHARLVWSVNSEEDSTTYGFRFFEE